MTSLQKDSKKEGTRKVDKAKNMNRKQFLSANKVAMQNRILVTITYNRYAEYIEYYYKKLEHFTNITYSSKSI